MRDNARREINNDGDQLSYNLSSLLTLYGAIALTATPAPDESLYHVRTHFRKKNESRNQETRGNSSGIIPFLKQTEKGEVLHFLVSFEFSFDQSPGQ